MRDVSVSRDRHVLRLDLLGAQGADRVHACRPTCRQPNRQQRDEQQNTGRGGERRGVERSDVVEEPRRRPHNGDGREGSQQSSCQNRPDTLSQHEAHDLTGVGAHCQADSHLTGALSDVIGHDAEYAERGQGQRDGREGGEEDCAEAGLSEPIVQSRCGCLRGVEREVGIEPPDDGS